MNIKQRIQAGSAVLGLLCLTTTIASAAPRTAPSAANKSTTAAPSTMKYEKSAKTAFSKAKSSQKIVFLLFTNERTCPPCKKLESQILSKPEFATALQEIAVPVKFAFPIRGEGTTLLGKYQVGGTPTIVYTDATGKKLGTSGYRGGNIQAYIDEAKRFHEQAYGK